MKKFTRVLQLMLVILFTSSVVFAQTTVQEANRSVTKKGDILKQKQLDQKILEQKATMTFAKAEGLEVTKAPQSKNAKLFTGTSEIAPKAGSPAYPSDWLFDFQFEWPLTNLPYGLSVGIETDGVNIYTCHWQTDTIYRYDMSGNYISWFIIPGVNLMRDMAYNENTGHFYGAAATTSVWEMDFTAGAEVLVSTITAPTAIRGIGTYTDAFGTDYLFGNNWGTDVYVFDLAGVTLFTFQCGVAAGTGVGDSYYGFAYDNISTGGPFIWGHAQIGTSLEWLVQMDEFGVETGVTFDVGTYLGHVAGNAGGLAVTPGGTFPGVAEPSIFGIAQNTSMWAFELGDPNPCSTPVALTEANIGDFSADLSWTPVGTATSWEIEFREATDPLTGVANQPTLTVAAFAATGLTSLTGYHWAVRSDCGGGSYSAWSPANTFSTTGGDCMWDCIGYDSYGDGWNGGSIDFVVDGATVANWTGPLTTGPETFQFPIGDPCTIDIVWNAGTWDGEVTYEIYDNFGTLIFSDGTNPTGTTGLNGYCTITCPPPTDMYADNFTGTTADANWTDANMENLYDLCWGLEGFDPDDALTYVGQTFGFSEAFPATLYSTPMTGLTYGLTYEFYVRTDCGTDETSFWVKSPTFISAPPPPNDECVNAQFVGTGGYPEVVLGTTLGATIDCPGVLDWDAVWYEVDLPYALNNFTVDYCGTANQETIGIVYYPDCSDCNAYVIAKAYSFYDCGTPGGVTVGQMNWDSIPGPTTIMFPVYQAPQQDFIVEFDVQEPILYPPPANDECINAEPVVGSFPVMGVAGTTNGATVDCPGVLDWDAVWYSIDLPYDYNYVELDLCLDDLAAVVANTGIILTTDCSCDASSFIFSTGTYAIAANCITDLNFYVEGPATVYYPVMTDPKGDFTFDVNVTEMYQIYGNFAYGSGAPMDLSEVTLDDGSGKAIIATTTTDLAGNYSFDYVAPGTYYVSGNTTKAFGGNTSQDLDMLKNFLNFVPGVTFGPLQEAAADVNFDAVVSSQDLDLMKNVLNFVPLAVYLNPEWLYETVEVTVGSDGSVNADFMALCQGDVNMDYPVPPAPLGASKVNPIPIGFPTDLSVLSQTNCGFLNTEEDTELGGYDGGEDIFYLLTTTSDYTLNITVDPKGTTWTGFFIDDDTDFTSVLAMSTNSGGEAHIIEGLFLPAGSYYIMVDTYPSPDCIPDFDLTIEEWTPPTDYCDASTTTQDECIGDVICGTISNLATGWQGAVGPYTAMSTVIAAGASEPITVNSGCNIWASDLVEVWVDWGADFVFDVGTDEEFILTNDGTGTSFTGAIAVPAGTPAGDYRMRVRMSYSASYGPCGVGSYGEVEDYTITVAP